MNRRGFIVPLAAAIWVAFVAIWFSAEPDLRLGPSSRDMREAVTGWYGLRRIEGYTGPVAKVQRADNKAMLDVGSVSDMRQFCAYTTCTVRTMYDQSGGDAHLNKVEP